jgi:hypothetical protein
VARSNTISNSSKEVKASS